MGLGMKLVTSLVSSAVKPRQNRNTISKISLFDDDIPSSGKNTGADLVEQKRKEILDSYKKANPTTGVKISSPESVPAPAASAAASTAASAPAVSTPSYQPSKRPNPGVAARTTPAPASSSGSSYKLDLTSPESISYAHSLEASFVLYLYLAWADGTVSELEQKELLGFIDNMRTNRAIPKKYRSGITPSMIDSAVPFSTVRSYLDKVDDDYLLALVSRVQFMAEVDGLTENEDIALDAVKAYVTKRTGHDFSKNKFAANPFDLICPTCGGSLKLSDYRNRVTCDYCGFVRIIDKDKL